MNRSEANQKDEDMLAKWNLEPKGLNVNIYTPHSYFKKYQDDSSILENEIKNILNKIN